MADNFNLDVMVRLLTIGAKQAKAEAGDVANAFQELAGDSEAARKATERLYDSISRGARSSTQTLTTQEKAFLRQDRIYSNYLEKQEKHYTQQDRIYNDYLDHQRRADEAAASYGNTLGNLSDSQLPRLRYALYDVSSTLTVVGAAMTALGVATFGTAISMDRAFADVSRTSELYLDKTGRAAKDLRQDFNELFSVMPVSWSDLTDIGTLAGQLNIASDSVAEFTRLVAMFAATTDVSVEQSATAFGRLAELLDVPASEFENLGSSILAVGVNSVATESQIIAISTQITAMAASAGFSADEVFGLSAALASLGTQPELSRGVIVRLFSNINNAITSGGERLEKFGAVARMTGAEFAQSWGDDAAGTLLRVMEGIGSQEGPAAVAALNELGIVAARDVPTLLRLAQNSDVLAESLSVAAQGYADGTALADQYGVIAETVAEKLAVLAQNFQLLVSAIGQGSGALGGLIDLATDILRLFTTLANNPVAATVATIAVSVTVLAGAISLLAGLALRGVAGLIAFRTVTAELVGSGFAASASLSSMTSALYGVATSSTAAATGIRGVGLAVRAIPVIGAVLAAAAIGFEIFERATMSARDRAEEFFGDLSGFYEAIERDSAADYAGKVFGEIEVTSQRAVDATDDARKSTETWLGVQRSIPSGVDPATDAISNQTVVLGENADAWLRKALVEQDAVRKLATDSELQDALAQVGFSIDEMLARSLQGGTALQEYVARIRSELGSLASDDFGGFAADYEKYIIAADAVDSLYYSLRDLAGAAQEAGSINKFLGLSADDAGQSIQEMADAAFQAFNDILDISNASLDLQSSIHRLGETLFENGDAWDYFSEAGRGNIGALMQVMNALAAQTPGDAAATASALQGLFDFIVRGGYASANQLQVLKSAIESLAGQSRVLPTTFNPVSFFGGWDSGARKASSSTRKLADSTKDARKEVRTLVDYARDLQSVFSRSFDLRFSGQSTLDGITSAFQTIRDAAEDAQRSIRSLSADIQGLQSDIKIQEYFLGIAIEYGDTARAEAIEANLAKLQADLADKTADLSKAQEEASKELTGNSGAAIRNREALAGLVQQYQEHIRALAASGMGQEELARRTEELRQDFIAQATQLGYNREELGLYEASFGDVQKAIEKVPRNVTVDFNSNPALQALAEFEAALDSARANAERGISLPAVSSPGVSKAARDAMFIAWLEEMRRQHGRSMYQSAAGLAALRASWERGAFEGFAEGGYTGRGGKYDPAGIVHRGEYVIPKKHVDQRTGLPYADALGKLQRGSRGPGYANGGYVRGGGFPSALQVASMGPIYAQQMQTMLNEAMRVTIGGQTLARAVSRENANGTYVGAS